MGSVTLNECRKIVTARVFGVVGIFDNGDVPLQRGTAGARRGLRRRSLFYLCALFCILAFLSRPAMACEQIPAGASFWIRLIDPIASYSSKPGTAIRATLIQSPECGSALIFPTGLEIEGKLISVRRVGLGFKHDTATLEVRFDRIVSFNGEIVPIAAQVVEIDNARETVHNGVIHGIRATDTPQGRITSRLIHLPTFNPYSDWGLLVYRSVFTRLPEPEIYLPPGTDLRLQLSAALDVSNQPELPPSTFQMDEYERGDVELLMANTSDRTTTRYGKDADIVNLLFVGSSEQVHQAFTAAGWQPSDPNSTHAFMRQFAAFLTLSNYPNMPISKQLLNGQPQDLTWQKSFDSYEKREHLRLWSVPGSVDGQQAWLGAYTRETGAALSIRYHKFIHHIDRDVDQGVVMLVRDLSLAGCVQSVGQLPRSDMPRHMENATGDEMDTDGVLDVVQLQGCERPPVEYTVRNPVIQIRPSRKVTRYIRTEVLLYKSDVIRGNAVYAAFDLVRMGVIYLRHRHEDYPNVANKHV
jgi:LssY C-terminus